MRRLLVEDLNQPFLSLNLEGTLDLFAATSIQYQAILGSNAGHKSLIVRNSEQGFGKQSQNHLTVVRHGLSLDASVARKPSQRRRYTQVSPIPQHAYQLDTSASRYFVLCSKSVFIFLAPYLLVRLHEWSVGARGINKYSGYRCL